jgi:hypothetical protein
LKIALRILRDPGEAEDVMQEIFFEIFNKAGQFDPTRGSTRRGIACPRAATAEIVDQITESPDKDCSEKRREQGGHGERDGDSSQVHRYFTPHGQRDYQGK